MVVESEPMKCENCQTVMSALSKIVKIKDSYESMERTVWEWYILIVSPIYTYL